MFFVCLFVVCFEFFLVFERFYGVRVYVVVFSRRYVGFLDVRD